MKQKTFDFNKGNSQKKSLKVLRKKILEKILKNKILKKILKKKFHIHIYTFITPPSSKSFKTSTSTMKTRKT